MPKTPKEILADPNFQGLPTEEKRKVMLAVDPQGFGALPPDQQDRVFSLVAQPSAESGGPSASAWEQLKQAGGAFLRQYGHDLNPITAISGAAQMLRHPGQALEADSAARDVEAQRSVDAFNRGDYVSGAAHFAGAGLPVLGPMLGTGYHAAVENGNPNETGQAVADIAALKTAPKVYGGISKAAGRAATATKRAVAPTAAGYGSKVLGKMTGAGGDAVTTLLNDPSGVAIKTARGQGPSELELVQHTRDALDKLRQKRRFEYQQDLAQIPQNPFNSQQLLGLKKNLLQRLADYNVNLKQIGKLGNSKTVVDLGSSKMAGKNPIVQQLYDDVMQWETRSPSNATPAGVDILKQRLDDLYTKSLKDGKPTAASSLIQATKEDVRNFLNQHVPGYQEMTSKYHNAGKLIDMIDSEFAASNGNPGVMIRKIANALNQNNEYRTTLLDALSNEAGVPLREMIAGNAMKSPYSKGLMGVLASGEALRQLGHPELWPAALGGALLTSPRAVAEAMNAIGNIRRAQMTANTAAAVKSGAAGAGKLTPVNSLHHMLPPPPTTGVNQNR